MQVRGFGRNRQKHKGAVIKENDEKKDKGKLLTVGEGKKKIKRNIRKECEQIRQEQNDAEKGELEMINEKIKAWEGK